MKQILIISIIALSGCNSYRCDSLTTPFTIVAIDSGSKQWYPSIVIKDTNGIHSLNANESVCARALIASRQVGDTIK